MNQKELLLESLNEVQFKFPSYYEKLKNSFNIKWFLRIENVNILIFGIVAAAIFAFIPIYINDLSTTECGIFETLFIFEFDVYCYSHFWQQKWRKTVGGSDSPEPLNGLAGAQGGYRDALWEL